jgi:hypothetical protein
MTVYQNCRKRTYKLKSNLDLGEESGFLGSKKILLFVLLANFLRTPSTAGTFTPTLVVLKCTEVYILL